MQVKTLGLLLLVLALRSAGIVHGQYPYRVGDDRAVWTNIDADYPGLERMKEALGRNDWQDAKTEYLRFFDERTDRRFLYRPGDREIIVAGLRSLYPGHEKGVLTRAGEVSEYRLVLESKELHWPGGDITWSDDNKEWINLLNRMGYLPDLGLAYWYTGDEAWFDVFWQWFSDWDRDNPVPEYEVRHTGGTWEPHRQSYTAPHGPWRALEVGTRIQNLLRCYYYFLDCERFDTEKKWQLIRSMMEHQRYVDTYLSRGALGNWENTVATGFLMLSVLTPEWENSGRILSYCRTTLNNNYRRSINADGFQFEQTPGYHKHVIEDGVRVQYYLAGLNGLKGFDADVLEKLEKGYEVILKLKKPDNRDPAIGDMGADIYGTRSVRTDPFFSSGALQFLNPVYKAASGGFSANDYLYFGHEGYERYASIPEAKNHELKSQLLPASNLVVMRSGGAFLDTAFQSLYCLFDNAPDGVGSHSHHDFLNLELFAYDKTLLIDPGRGNNYNDPLFLPYYRAVRGHNVVQVGPDSTFQLRKKAGSPQVRNETWITHPRYDYAKGVLEDYNGTDHHRELFFVKGEYWFLRDKLVGTGEQLLKQYFHTLPGEILVDEHTRSTRTTFTGHANLMLMPVLKDSLRVEIEEGYLGIGGVNTPAPIITYSKHRELPVTFETLIFPVRRGEQPQEPKVFPIRCEANDPDRYFAFRIELPEGKTDRFYLSEGDRPVAFGPDDRLDGTLAFCRTVNGKPELASMMGKTFRQEKLEIEAETPGEVTVEAAGPHSYACRFSVPIRRLVLPVGKISGKIQVTVQTEDGSTYRLPGAGYHKRSGTVTLTDLPPGTFTYTVETYDSTVPDVE